MANGAYEFVSFSSRALNRLARRLSKISERFMSDSHQRAAVIGSTAYDMFNEPDEKYYADQYMRLIRPALRHVGPNAHVIDLGCGQGRLTQKFAEQFPSGTIYGCDISETAIESARERFSTLDITNASFVVEEIADFLERVEVNSVEIMMMTEVTIFFPDWQEILKQATKKMRLGGVLIVSFRPQYFNALLATQYTEMSALEQVLSIDMGRLWPGRPVEFTWQTSSAVFDFYSQELGLEDITISGIGVLSGIPGDPRGSVCQPSVLDSKSQEQLMRAELCLAQSLPDAGRYFLAVGRKR